MYYLFLIFIFFILSIIYKLIFIYLLECLYLTSYLLSSIIYFFNFRKKIINYNLKNIIPKITIKKCNELRFYTYQYLIMNSLILLISCIYGDTFLLKYYKVIDKPNDNNKKIFIGCHIGLYYDIISIYKFFSKSTLSIIYKKYIDLDKRYKKKNKNLNCINCKNINFDKLNKSKIIAVLIDQKSYSSNIIVKFLNKKLYFHSTQIKYAIKNNRDIYVSYIIINNKKIINQYIKIEVKNKELKEICQDIANKFMNIILKYPEQYLWLHNRFNIS